MKKNKSVKKLSKKITDWYINFSEEPKVVWFRSILQSLDVEFNPSVGIKLSIGQFLERFIFTQADIKSSKRVENGIKSLNIKLKKVTLDQKRIKNNVEEYARLFIRFCGMVGAQSYEELRKSYVNQLSNFFDIKYSKNDNKLFYQQLVFKLTVDHLHILMFAKKYLGREMGKKHENSKKLRQAIKGEFIKKGLDEALIFGLIKDLDSMGLMNSTQSSLWGGDLHQLYVSSLGYEILDQINQ